MPPMGEPWRRECTTDADEALFKITMLPASATRYGPIRQNSAVIYSGDTAQADGKCR